MARFFKAIGSVIVTFLIFFGVPVFVYSSFQRFLGMVPPAQLTQAAVYQLASLKGAEAFILVFIQAGVIAELWYYLTLKSPELYTAAGVVSSFISYMLSGWLLGRFYKTTSNMILP